MNQTVQAMDAATWGAWGQWAAAWATFLAVGVAMGVAIVDSRRRTRDMLEQRAAQARTITAQVEQIPDTYPGSPITLQQQVVTVQNHGTLPITNVTLDSIFARDTAANPVTEWTLENTSKNPSMYQLCLVLGPGQSEHSSKISFISEGPINSNSVRVKISFVDAHGFRWSRDGNGTPTMVPGARELLRGDHYYLDRKGRWRFRRTRWRRFLPDPTHAQPPAE